MDLHTSFSLQDVASLSSAGKTALIKSIAREMTNTFITITKESQRGTLNAHHTAALQHFLRTIRRNETAQRRKLERKLARYERRAQRWRAERRWIRGEIAEVVRRMENVHQRWKTRVEALEKGFKKKGSVPGFGSTSGGSGLSIIMPGCGRGESSSRQSVAIMGRDQDNLDETGR